LGEAALQRALNNFTLKKQVQEHELLYESLHNNNIEKRSGVSHAEPSA